MSFVGNYLRISYTVVYVCTINKNNDFIYYLDGTDFSLGDSSFSAYSVIPCYILHATYDNNFIFVVEADVT